MALVDTHCHLDFSVDESGWIQRAKGAGVTKLINVGTSVEGSRKSIEIAEEYSVGTNREKRFWTSQNDIIGSRNKFGMTEEKDFQIFSSVGIHPQDGQKDIEKSGSLEKCIDKLRKIAQSSGKVVAVGEIGLDYYVVTSNTKHVTTDKEKEFQRKLFIEQIKLAQELDLPILVHCRNAWDEIFEIISISDIRHSRLDRESGRVDSRFRGNDNGRGGNDRGENGKFSTLRQAQGSKNNIKGLFHSWTGDWEAANKALDLGFYISFSGIVTFKNAPLVQEVAKKIPLDRILVETDSPFLSPEPYRGETNEPKNVIITARFLAQLRGISLDTIEEVTSENAGRLLGI